MILFVYLNQYLNLKNKIMQVVKTRQQEKEMFRRLNDKAKMKIVFEQIEESRLKQVRLKKQQVKVRFIFGFTLLLLSFLTYCFIFG